jgi:hypothetical protein
MRIWREVKLVSAQLQDPGDVTLIAATNSRSRDCQSTLRVSDKRQLGICEQHCLGCQRFKTDASYTLLNETAPDTQIGWTYPLSIVAVSTLLRFRLST